MQSTDPRIKPVIRVQKVEAGNEETTIVDVYFDPGVSTSESQREFIEVNAGGVSGFDPKVKVDKTRWKLLDLGMKEYSSVISEALKTVDEEDVALWRSYLSQTAPNQPTWIDGDWKHGIYEDIKANVTINTSIVSQINVPVKASIKRPQLTGSRYMDFGGV